MDFGEVQYYFRTRINDNVHTLAVVSLYGPPDKWLLEASHDTLWSCENQGDDGLVVIEVREINSVVAMVPHRPRINGKDAQDRYFVVEKIGLDIANMGGWRDKEEMERLQQSIQGMDV